MRCRYASEMHSKPLDDHDGPSDADLERFGGDDTDCPSCGRSVYDDLPLCPHCGHAIADSDRPGGPSPVAVYVMIALVALISLGFAIRLIF